MYEYLIQYYKAGDISFKYVKTFNMDEYVGKRLRIPEYMRIKNYNTYTKLYEYTNI